VKHGSQYATWRRIYATRWRKWIFVEWHLFVIRQLCRMTKRLRGRKRVISPELITRTFPEIETTYLSTYIPYLLRTQTATLAISRVTMGAISNRQSLRIAYLHFHKLRTTRIDLFSSRKKFCNCLIKLQQWLKLHLICIWKIKMTANYHCYMN